VSSARPHKPHGAPDANFIHFEIRDGIRRITCSVPNDVMDAVSGISGPLSPGLRRRSFDRFRTLIHGAAMQRLKDMPAGSAGPIVLARRDLRSVALETEQKL
jgi:hypothetical protein